jgi:hypothetical protein
MTVIDRIKWGYRAGTRAYANGWPTQNPFTRIKGVREMHDSWARAWRDAARLEARQLRILKEGGHI